MILKTAPLSFFVSISTLQAQNICNVKDFGAIGTKNQKATSFIQKAIDVCAEKGGGIVLFPSGEYVSGQINLKSNITLHLEAGATLFASQDKNDFFISENYQADNQAKTPNKTFLIFGENLQNVSITGKGTIDGQAEHEWSDLITIDNFIREETEIAQKSGIEMKRAYVKEPKVRLVYLHNIQNLHIENITLQRSPDWTLHIGASEHVVVKGVRIFSDLNYGVNADGIDIDGGKNIHISDCTVETGDDAICLKTTYNNGNPVALENVTVSNCALVSTSCALKIGTESYADMKNIIFNNCIISNSNRGIGIFVRDGASVENVLFSNLIIECNRKHFNWWGDGDAMRFVVLKRNADSKVGSIKNLHIINVVARQEGTSLFAGFEGKPLENIYLQNVQITHFAERTADKRSTDILRFETIQNLNIHSLQTNWNKNAVEPKWKSALALLNVKKGFISCFEGSQSPSSSQQAAIRLENCKDIIVERSRALEGTAVFLQINGANSSNIVLEDNYLEKALRKVELGNNINKKLIKIE
ncbi:MAG: glycosyl hydrolase family 28 protein [Cytophagales bacterium]|nr:glycosyl hydrolase family 28 protein [Cytophagales bacterium]MDW8384072.1 glycosyl hydrolase family 28 protein [Flammeovirgaceae bacterium]